MKKLTYAELKAMFRKHEETYPKEHLTGYIVFTEDSFAVPYSLESRTYVVSSDNKAFRPHMGGYSIYASCLDPASDPCVRLEQYMEDEYAGKGGWRVEYCYLPDADDAPPWE